MESGVEAEVVGVRTGGVGDPGEAGGPGWREGCGRGTVCAEGSRVWLTVPSAVQARTETPEDEEEEEEERPLTAAEARAAQKREERLRKFRELHMKRNEARKLNHQEVVEEDKRLKLPANWEAKKARLEWELQVEEKKKECAARGEDYERVKLLEISAEDAERWERKKKRKNPDLGFSDYAAAQLRQYHRLTKQIKPDMETYEKLREKHGEEFYPTSNSLLHGTHVPSTEEIDRMVIDLEKQIEKREKYSRRRPYNDDSDIDYINERNAKFNKKAERFYGKYTAEIKQNLERGTAV
uniref:Pre-mRNA-splicing factor SYF2 n=1 Tax=Vombatus ursinus TaxID=29139 RepID=A0A4X2K3G1_VOMUR